MSMGWVWNCNSMYHTADCMYLIGIPQAWWQDAKLPPIHAYQHCLAVRWQLKRVVKARYGDIVTRFSFGPHCLYRKCTSLTCGVSHVIKCQQHTASVWYVLLLCVLNELHELGELDEEYGTKVELRLNVSSRQTKACTRTRK